MAKKCQGKYFAMCRGNLRSNPFAAGCRDEENANKYPKGNSVDSGDRVK